MTVTQDCCLDDLLAKLAVLREDGLRHIVMADHLLDGLAPTAVVHALRQHLAVVRGALGSYQRLDAPARPANWDGF